jgi:hypothetical protein
LPAAVRLKQLALAQARRRFPDLGQLEALRDLELGGTVQPGEKLTLALTRRGQCEVDFSLRGAQRAACSGTFQFAEREP